MVNIKSGVTTKSLCNPKLDKFDKNGKTQYNKKVSVSQLITKEV